MKLTDILNRKTGVYLDYKDVPNSFVGTILIESIIENGITWEISLIGDKSGVVKEKLTSLHLRKLGELMQKMGIDDTKELVDKKCRFQAFYFRIGFPRWLPVELIKG